MKSRELQRCGKPKLLAPKELNKSGFRCQSSAFGPQTSYKRCLRVEMKAGHAYCTSDHHEIVTWLPQLLQRAYHLSSEIS